jgi:hypothetical protein
MMNDIELLKINKELTTQNQQSLLSYAQFLLSEQQPTSQPPQHPLTIPRPQTETVIGALKRLRKTYPMIDPDTVMDRTAELVTAHLIHGKPAADIIDQCEQVFLETYQHHYDLAHHNN